MHLIQVFLIDQLVQVILVANQVRHLYPKPPLKTCRMITGPFLKDNKAAPLRWMCCEFLHRFLEILFVLNIPGLVVLGGEEAGPRSNAACFLICTSLTYHIQASAKHHWAIAFSTLFSGSPSGPGSEYWGYRVGWGHRAAQGCWGPAC